MKSINLYDRVHSDMIAKAIQGSITKTYPKKLRIHRGEYELEDSGGIIKNDGPTMIHL